MLDVHGFVAETNATHLFFVEGGVVSTSRTVACPEGITRAAVLELCLGTRDSPSGPGHFALRDLSGR